MIWLSTSFTPGADQATCSASCRSTQDRTVPFNVTLSPSTSTVIRSASVSAFRTASSDYCSRPVAGAMAVTNRNLLANTMKLRSLASIKGRFLRL
jgi:hypothetical protein